MAGDQLGQRQIPRLRRDVTFLASAFRSTGFGVDTVATLPLWRFSFYGRMGAYRGDARNGFGIYSTSLQWNPGWSSFGL